MINVALVGNPNTGKTTLFNTLTFSNEHTGNWHGVTVEEKAKIYKVDGREIKLIDLPGVYSLSPMSYEEEVTLNYLLNKEVDVIVNICDASNLKRNLYLTLSLMELGKPIILVINQIERRQLFKIDVAGLEKMLGVRVVKITAKKKSDGQILNKEILNFKENTPILPYVNKLPLEKVDEKKLPLFYKIKLLEDDETIKNKLNITKTFGEIDRVAEARYDHISEIEKRCLGENLHTYGKSKLDNIFLNRFLAIPIFTCILALIFYLTFFSIGAYLSEGLNFLLNKFVARPLLNVTANSFGETSWVFSLVEVALVGGVGSVLSFLPQVVMLLLFLSLLEESGYLSRVAFISEDILGKVGLSGKSVYTLLMGFGCSTSAILTARNMDDKNSKIKTALLTPYMSCSAKFPVYAVLGGAFFGAKNIFVIIGLYFLGVALAVLMSYIYEKTILKSKAQSFILEFPAYRMMDFKSTVKNITKNVKEFVTRVGSLILSMNVIVWLLSNFTIKFSYIGQTGGVSILETVGKIISPIFWPLGLRSWGISSALLAGLVAKEVIVSSIALLNGVDEANFTSIGLSTMQSSSAVYFASPSSVLSFLVFCLLYIPCIASISVLGKEVGKKWLLIGVGVEFLTAYFVAFMIYNISLAVEKFGFVPVAIFLGIIMLIVSSVILIIGRFKGKKGCPYGGKCKKECNKKR